MNNYDATIVEDYPLIAYDKCQVCNSERVVPLYIVQQENFPYIMGGCKSCLHIQVFRTKLPPERKVEERDYFNFKDGYHKEKEWEDIDKYWGKDRRSSAENILDHLASLGFPRGTILDVGCAFGHFLNLASEKGYRVIGVEPSPMARELAGEKFGIPTVSHIDLLSKNELTCNINIVVCMETFFYICDIQKMLRTMRRHLQPGGCLLVKMRANRNYFLWAFAKAAGFSGRLPILRPGSFLYGTNLRAYHHFTTKGICKLLEREGFTVIDVVNEKDVGGISGFSFRSILRTAYKGLQKLIEALTPRHKKIGKVISVYAVKNSTLEQ